MATTFISKQLRSKEEVQESQPSWLRRQVVSGLQSISRRACVHPIHTLVVIAILASTTYVGLLEGSLLDTSRDSQSVAGQVDTDALLQGSRNLRLGESTSWKWQAEDIWTDSETEKPAAQHLALATLIFPDSTSNSVSTAPAADDVPVPANVSAKSVPYTPNLFSQFTSDSSLAYTVPFEQVSELLKAVQEIPNSSPEEEEEESKMWIMRAARGPAYGSRRAVKLWFADAWNSFVDLIKHAETIDIVIMALGYLSMHLSFVSLFFSMRRLGSNFWLAATVLLSGAFAFLFGLHVTTKLGVPINLLLLSEGLPFLVVTIGFEKPIMLTRAVLKASVDGRRPGPGAAPRPLASSAPRSIQDSITAAIKDQGFEIVQHYCIEIGLLALGAASGVQGGLQQFCFLAALILFFDCVLLFTFYTTILCIKLEITRIKRHVALRKALEEDGINRSVAENVASSNDWPSAGSGSNEADTSIFGRKIKSSNVRRFKILMVGGLILINVVNMSAIPFRNTGNSGLLSRFSSVLAPTPIDPFKVAENGLDAVYVAAKSQKQETVVTILSPIKYKLEYPSVHYAAPLESGSFDIEYSDQFLDAVGGKVLESLLKSVEDPFISKWIIAALTLSIILNGYLFNAARWSIKEPEAAPAPPVEPVAAPKVYPKFEPNEGESNRTREECEALLKAKQAPMLNDEELIDLSLRGKLPGYALEKSMEDENLMSRVDAFTRAVKIRRSVVARTPITTAITATLEESKLPYKDYNYGLVHGACCENVIGYLPLPLGVAGPINIDGQMYFIPMATTEGVLVASTSRGSKAINAGGGAVTVLTGDGMTRGPCVTFPTLARAAAAKVWIDSEEGRSIITAAFNSTSRFARLQSLKTALAGTYLYIRFKTTTGDAMGMNMISKGCEKAMDVMSKECGFDDMDIISLSGNFCTDKKSAAINWTDGRGKSVVAEAIIPGDIVKSVLKSDVNALVELNISKNLIGSAMAGSLGGFNAHASNIVSAIFLATGQDPAQNVESSSCITTMKNNNGNLQIAVSMPSIEVGTIGGGTILEAQGAMLDLLGVRGSHPTTPGENARQLARIIAAAVLAGELSLCAALAAGHLVKAHMAHNRSAAPTRSSTPVSSAVGAARGLSMTSK
ncbi:Hydroxymethylglutaryl-CoA reductase class I/II substrate-binding [Penicillium brevicompactum]|uniref:3-hydroxy-3-methylglutaryl coenzyme A reductase n=1 Tax=Penicillium brevicompactum TaxID=5074 RepID=A0A9W9UHG7_PENBR|nr:Hydroxymethylglutaryl-CoA reductase class I/II substrate-binding [Penicillium brevicompactum]KAJ5327543.1 Hydroxymethylglutaryl-CoA reductase class I/II substrate-binding [Penicillium brevicompactum]KAJ5337654.1 Hydroxymethylglutaryl-CoA reductase class I/II substrate-binding [Penicillium brevicompactum]KAJ5340519.1 Hydroxymethylglutaryl-CoA reductase class I/II substrate-binding [Penicillium brevicompactum]